MPRYFYIYKPYNFLSQFTKEHFSHQVLGDLSEFPTDVYPIGRLDRDSEGLLIITNDKKLTDRLLNPKKKYPKTYWAQLDGDIDDQAIGKLRKGVSITVNKKKYITKPAKIVKIEEPDLPERTPPVRYRANIPTSWVQLTITEGKNRQVRKMGAAVGYPVLRLVRCSIGNLKIQGMEVGEVREVDAKELGKMLSL